MKMRIPWTGLLFISFTAMICFSCGPVGTRNSFALKDPTATSTRNLESNEDGEHESEPDQDQEQAQAPMDEDSFPGPGPTPEPTPTPNPTTTPSDGEQTAFVSATRQRRFSPSSVSIRVGGSVTWRNASRLSETVTADPDSVDNPDNVEIPIEASPFDSGLLEPGETFTKTFDVPGRYRYVSLPHESEGMFGTVIVSP